MFPYRLGLEANNYTPIKSPSKSPPSSPAVISHDPRTGREVKVVNNQKIVSDSQLEDELKKYCRIDTSQCIDLFVHDTLHYLDVVRFT